MMVMYVEVDVDVDVHLSSHLLLCVGPFVVESFQC